MRDIWDGDVMKRFTEPDGKPFFVQSSTTGRYGFSLNVDGFNPFGGKHAGKQASVTGIYQVCLSLPPELRYRPENVYLADVAPGPSKLSRHHVNHLLKHLVDDLEIMWNEGMSYVMKSCPSGCKVRCALLPLVCDMIAAHEVAGFTSQSSTHSRPY